MLSTKHGYVKVEFGEETISNNYILAVAISPIIARYSKSKVQLFHSQTQHSTTTKWSFLQHLLLMIVMLTS